uniref:Uncharacterized protein AlNc14C82G5345 n=1 Tax=Albugo laibachii Nc14 TaxID=890382 RepID=F0WFF6_9STRA|nr:conserved hypothetical protein [Albugo laibachii Nc14]|eukprot:CCA19938.1 conserved hypothetical protein [Albugo laibachii Nc14]
MTSRGDLHLPLIAGTFSSKMVEKRLNFLWKSAQHFLFAEKYAIANQFTDSVMRVARDAKAVLPANVLASICECCNAFLIPSLTSDVRVKSISKSSSYNTKRYKKLQNVKKRLALVAAKGSKTKAATRLRNVVCVTCHRCRYVSIEDGASVRATKSNSKAKSGRASGTYQPRDEPSSKDVPKQSMVGEIKSNKRSARAQSNSPCKLLDNPKKKKKKKLTANEAAAKSELDSFLRTVHPSFGS